MDKIIRRFIATVVVQTYLVLVLLFLRMVNPNINFIEVWTDSNYVKLACFIASWLLMPWIMILAVESDKNDSSMIPYDRQSPRFYILVILGIWAFVLGQYFYKINTDSCKEAVRFVLHDERTRRMTGEIKSADHKLYSNTVNVYSFKEAMYNIEVIAERGQFRVFTELTKDDAGVWHVKSAAIFDVKPWFNRSPRR